MLLEPVQCATCKAVSVNGGTLHCHRCYEKFNEAIGVIFHNLDSNGDPVGAQPEGPWETGYCAGLRFAYRTMKSRGIELPAAPTEKP